MPSTPTDHHVGPGAPSGLLADLVDDAAVFPPGNATLQDAVARHLLHRNAWYAGCVGPLLVAAASVAHLVEVLDARGAGGGDHEVAAARGSDPTLRVVLVARPGADPLLVTSGLAALRDERRVQVVGAELAWQPSWRDLGLDDLALALEVPRGDGQAAALDDIHRGHGEGRTVVAKFRTGATATWPWPDERELAQFLIRCLGLGAPFKLTGGLHHAVRGTYEVDGVPEENHGLLNVLLATSAALEGGGPAEVGGLLALRERDALAGVVGAWPEATARRVRAAFTAYGCCTVTDPVGELADLDLLHRP